MRKVLIFGFFLIVFYLFLPQKVQAQGTFSCSWDYSLSPPMCVPDLINHNCASGYIPDASHCLAFVIPDECNRQQNIPCISTTSPPTGPCKENEETWTALGCINTSSPQEFIVWLLKSVIGIAGGIAFLLMLWGGFQIITSTGNPEKLNKGKEILTSAIIGLVVIIFAVFLLQLIGVQILQIPGFSK